MTSEDIAAVLKVLRDMERALEEPGASLWRVERKYDYAYWPCDDTVTGTEITVTMRAGTAAKGSKR